MRICARVIMARGRITSLSLGVIICGICDVRVRSCIESFRITGPRKKVMIDEWAAWPTNV